MKDILRLISILLAVIALFIQIWLNNKDIVILCLWLSMLIKSISDFFEK